MPSIKLIPKPKNIDFVDYYYEFDTCKHITQIFKKKGLSYFKFKDFYVAVKMEKKVFYLEVSDKKHKKNKDLKLYFEEYDCGCCDSSSDDDSDSSDSESETD
jgi:hypothetical protein